MTVTDINAILPVLILAAYGCVLMLVDLLIPDDQKRWTAWLAFLGIVAAAVGLAFWPRGLSEVAFKGMLLVDGYAVFLDVIILLTAGLTVLLALNYLPRAGLQRGEFYYLLLFTVSGMMLMAQAGDLLMVFLALELLSIPLYILSGFARPKPASEESALKYFLLGAFASAFLVYGIALVYGATGTTNLAAILAANASGQTQTGLLALGAGLVLVGLGFKVAVVPFHMWTPDVYDGAPSVVTAFMSVGAKTGGFAALLRVFLSAFPGLATDWVVVAAAISALTMTLGNFAAIAQSNIKRMLAYSSIAHAGYILMGLVAASSTKTDLRSFAVGASLYYLLAYALTNLGTWAVVMAVERAEGEGLKIDDYAGLGWRAPRPGAGHGAVHALADRPAADGGADRQDLRLPGRHRRRLYVAGADRRADLARLGLLLPARGFHDVHARRRGPGALGAAAQLRRRPDGAGHRGVCHLTWPADAVGHQCFYEPGALILINKKNRVSPARSAGETLFFFVWNLFSCANGRNCTPRRSHSLRRRSCR